MGFISGVYPALGKKVVGDITAADIKKLLNCMMTDGYAYTTVKKVYVLLNEYFRYLYQQEIIVRNPMANVEMIKKANFMAAQGKENLPPTDSITVFSEEEIEKFKTEAFSVFSNGNRKYQQAAAYILMLNTGLRTGEALGLLNSDVDIEHRVLHIQRGVKEISKRSGVTAEHGREVAVVKLKSANSVIEIMVDSEKVYSAEGETLAFQSNLNTTKMAEALSQLNQDYGFSALDDRQILMTEMNSNNLESLIMVVLAGLVCFPLAIISSSFIGIQWWILIIVLGFIFLILPAISTALFASFAVVTAPSAIFTVVTASAWSFVSVTAPVAR